MNKVLKILMYILIVVAIIGFVFWGIKSYQNRKEELNWVKTGSYKVGEEVIAGEYVVISTGEKSSYEILKDDMSIANDTVDNQAYITLAKEQTVKLSKAKMCKIDKAPVFKSDDGVYKQGMYKVGRDLSAGEYVLKADGSAYYAVLSSSNGSIDSVVESSSFYGEVKISLKTGQYIKLIDATMKSK